MKASIVYFLFPTAASAVLLFFWFSNRSAQARLDRVRQEVQTISDLGLVPSANPVSDNTDTEKPQDESDSGNLPDEDSEPLPPIVVPGTVDELALGIVEVMRLQRDAEKDGLTRAEEVAVSQKFTTMLTPLVAGYDILRSELGEAAGGGQLIGKVIGGVLELDDKTTEQLTASLIEAREAIMVQGEDGELVSDRFFNDAGEYLAPEQVQEIKNTFGHSVRNLGSGILSFLSGTVF